MHNLHTQQWHSMSLDGNELGRRWWHGKIQNNLSIADFIFSSFQYYSFGLYENEVPRLAWDFWQIIFRLSLPAMNIFFGPERNWCSFCSRCRVELMLKDFKTNIKSTRRTFFNFSCSFGSHGSLGSENLSRTRWFCRLGRKGDDVMTEST